MFFRPISVATSIALLSSVVSAGISGQIVQIVDANNFCVFLPPTDSTDRLISDTEWDGQAFCLGDAPLATGAETIPSGFILSAHYVKETAYVQITGEIDYTKASLDGTDEGGQYDIKAPTGATCAGWDYFVNLIEPAGNTYCIRCCNDATNCNRGISQDGCARIVPGDYSGPTISSSSSSSDSIGTTTTTTTTTTSAETSSGTDSSSTGISSAVSSVVSSAAAITQSSSVASPASSPIASTASTSTAQSSSTPSADVSGSVSAQSVNSAGSIKPAALTLSAMALAAVAYLA